MSACHTLSAHCVSEAGQELDLEDAENPEWRHEGQGIIIDTIEVIYMQFQAYLQNVNFLALLEVGQELMFPQW